MLSKIKGFGWGYIILGALLCTVGVCFVSFNNAYNVLATVIGIFTALCGIGLGVATLIRKDRGIKFACLIVIAICCIVSGTVTAITQSQAISVIANIFFLLLLVDGAFKLQLSILSARFSFFGWWIMTVGSVTLIVCAFLMTKLTPTDETQLSVLTGLLLIFDGALNILSSFWNTAVLKVAVPQKAQKQKKTKKEEPSKMQDEESSKAKDGPPLFFAPDEDPNE